ncbi:hypothetical protein [Bacillus rhizoplanae]|uniref:hypothetical protein n=1 Tax=Bacillus rhizoplanae TaxID=2880966 RepID=UPI003D225C74
MDIEKSTIVAVVKDLIELDTISREVSQELFRIGVNVESLIGVIEKEYNWECIRLFARGNMEELDEDLFSLDLEEFGDEYSDFIENYRFGEGITEGEVKSAVNKLLELEKSLQQHVKELSEVGVVIPQLQRLSPKHIITKLIGE